MSSPVTCPLLSPPHPPPPPTNKTFSIFVLSQSEMGSVFSSPTFVFPKTIFFSQETNFAFPDSRRLKLQNFSSRWRRARHKYFCGKYGGPLANKSDDIIEIIPQLICWLLWEGNLSKSKPGVFLQITARNVIFCFCGKYRERGGGPLAN